MSQPNILWIYCDELRSDALGCYDNPYAPMKTPHIDSIAEQGIRFDNCFCNSPVCVASRTSVLTGLYPEATGVYHNEAVWPNYQFASRLQTLPSILQAHGYATANFGKVHVPQALQQWMHSDTSGGGMREFYEDVDQEALQIIRPSGIPTAVGGVFPGDRAYPAEVVTDNALAWLAQTDGPFFARLSYLQPHTPVFPPPPFDQLYMSTPFPDSVAAPDSASLSQFEQRFGEVVGTRQMSGREIFLSHAYYYGLVAWIDSQVGRMLGFLQERDLLEKTIIIFDADHGASLGEQGRFQKQTFAPQSHRVPRLISWPGTIPGGQERTDINESLDLARTLFSLTGIDAPAQFKGRDLLNDPARDAVYGTIGYGFATSRAFPNLDVGDYTHGHGWPRRSCIRTQQYRLDKNIRLDGQPVGEEDADIFLADMQADPQENWNLAGDPRYQQVVAKLVAQLDAHVAGAVEVEEGWTLRDRESVDRNVLAQRASRSMTRRRPVPPHSRAVS